MDKTVKKMDKAAVKRGKYAVISDGDMAITKRAVSGDRATSSDIVKKTTVQLVDFSPYNAGHCGENQEGGRRARRR